MQLYSCRRLFALSCLKVTQASTAPRSDSLFQLLQHLSTRSSIVNDLWPVITYQCCQWNFWTVFCRNISPEEIPTTSNCFGGLNSELCFVFCDWRRALGGKLKWELPVANNCCSQTLIHIHRLQTHIHTQRLQTFSHQMQWLTHSSFSAERSPRCPSFSRGGDTGFKAVWGALQIFFFFAAQIPQKNMNYKKCVKLEIPQKRRTKKFYLALLRGHVEEDRVDIDIPIGERPK